MYTICRQTQLSTRWYANLLNVNLNYMFRPQSLAIIRLYKRKLINQLHMHFVGGGLVCIQCRVGGVGARSRTYPSHPTPHTHYILIYSTHNGTTHLKKAYMLSHVM